MIADYLSAASVGLCPDQKAPLSDVSTTNKTMGYLAFDGLPVAFDLIETSGVPDSGESRGRVVVVVDDDAVTA